MNRWSLAVTALSLALSLAWGLFLPNFESPDEQNHYRYMVFLKDHGRLPRQLPLPAESTGEGHQPPFYYGLGALALKAFAPDAAFTEPPTRPTAFDLQPVYFVRSPEEGLLRFEGQAWPPHLLRILQLFALTLPGLLALAFILHRLLPPPWSQSVFALLALNPAFVALGGALNNDHGAFCFGTLAFACFLPALQGRELTARAWAAFGVLAGAAALAKPTALGLLLAPAVLLWRRPSELRKPGPWLAGLVLAAVLGWWFLRNLTLYGDATAFNAIVADCPQCLNPKPLLSLRWWRWWGARTFESFWGVFGWMTWSAPLPYTLLMAGACGWSLAGLWKGRALSAEARALAWAVLAGVLAVVLRHDLVLDPPAGRYLYAALAPLGLLLGHGASGWGWRPRKLPWALAAGLASFDLWLILARLIPAYHPSS